MKVAVVKSPVINIFCPECGEAWASPSTGSYDIYPGDEFTNSACGPARLVCRDCGESFKLPTKNGWISSLA